MLFDRRHAHFPVPGWTWLVTAVGLATALGAQPRVDLRASPESRADRVDPWLGSPVVVGPLGGYAAATAVDAAYHAGSDRFIVAWSAYSSDSGGSLSAWTNAQRVAPDGTAVGLPICVECDPSTESAGARVACVEGANVFLVAMNPWLGGGPVTLATLDPLAGAYPVGITNVSLSVGSYDVGGGATKATTALLVTAGNTVTATLVECRGQRPEAGATVVVARPGVTTRHIRVTGTAGTEGRYLSVWQQGNELAYAVIDPQLRVLDQGCVDGVATPPTSQPWFDVAGDGSTWLIAYVVDRLGLHDIWAATVVWNASTGTADVGAPFPVAVEPALGESDPSVTYTDGSFLIGYVANDRVVVPIEPFARRVCGPAATVAVRRTLLSALAGQPGGDRAVLGWESGGIRARVYRADDGITRDLGGGCGGGEARALCAVRGNAQFHLRLRGAAALIPAAVAVGAPGPGAPCGPCRFVPDLGAALVVAGMTGSAGGAGLLVPLLDDPAVVGLTFAQQWLTLAGVGCAGSVAFSNALEVQIQ
ncbi:MAG: hypothetical protein AAF628_20500 [Planctomycetota bacterium]